MLAKRAMSAKSSNPWAWVLTAVLVYVFVAAAVVKLAGARLAIEEFQTFGYPQWVRYAVAAIEIAGATMLLIRKTAVFAAALLGAVMAGACISHLAAHQAVMAFIPVVMRGLLGIVGRIRWRQRFQKEPYKSR
jgi:putative oxidoreductase